MMRIILLVIVKSAHPCPCQKIVAFLNGCGEDNNKKYKNNNYKPYSIFGFLLSVLSPLLIHLSLSLSFFLSLSLSLSIYLSLSDSHPKNGRIKFQIGSLCRGGRIQCAGTTNICQQREERGHPSRG